MKLKKIILSLIFIGSFNLSFAQVNLSFAKAIDGVVGNIGLTYRSTNSHYYKNEFRLSGSLGVFKEIKIAKSPTLRLELLVFQFNSSRSARKPFRTHLDRITNQLSFLSFTTLYKFKPNKFGFHIGPHANMLLAFRKIEEEFMFDGSVEKSISGPNLLLEYDITSDYGIRVGIDLSITHRTSLTLDYSRTLLSIDPFGFNLRKSASFISLGIIYLTKGFKNSL